VTKEFCADLEANDVFSLYKQGIMNKTEIAEIAMIHGDADESASFEDAKRFAEQVGAKLTVVEGGKHRLMRPGQMELVLETAIEFFTES
jgi:predicted alpha/beta hydrolase family esterase